MNNEQMLIKCKDPRKCRFYAEYLNHKYPNEFPQFAPDNPQNCIRNVNSFLKEKYYKASNNSLVFLVRLQKKLSAKKLMNLKLLQGRQYCLKRVFSG